MNGFECIKSKDNSTIKFISKLQSSSSFRKESAAFVLEGIRLCLDATHNGFSLETLVITEQFYDNHFECLEEFETLAKRKIIVDENIFSKISDTKTPQGILCVCKMPEYASSICEIESGKYIFLENLQDPSNLGAISRTAEALGINGLIVNGGCDPFSPKSLRAAMGALLRIKVYFSYDFNTDINLLKQKGFKIFATVPRDNDAEVSSVDYSGNCAVLIGNEGNGLTQTAKKSADLRITIPMSGLAESLNAAAAASIVMWEMVK